MIGYITGKVIYSDAGTVLLENGGKRAKEIKAKFKPVYPSIKDYVEFKKSQTAENDTVIQNGDGSITVL